MYAKNASLHFGSIRPKVEAYNFWPIRPEVSRR